MGNDADDGADDGADDYIDDDADNDADDDSDDRFQAIYGHRAKCSQMLPFTRSLPHLRQDSDSGRSYCTLNITVLQSNLRLQKVSALVKWPPFCYHRLLYRPNDSWLWRSIWDLGNNGNWKLVDLPPPHVFGGIWRSLLPELQPMRGNPQY
jgi:hypothetical protein